MSNPTLFTHFAAADNGSASYNFSDSLINQTASLDDTELALNVLRDMAESGLRVEDEVRESGMVGSPEPHLSQLADDQNTVSVMESEEMSEMINVTNSESTPEGQWNDIRNLLRELDSGSDKPHNNFHNSPDAQDKEASVSAVAEQIPSSSEDELVRDRVRPFEISLPRLTDSSILKYIENVNNKRARRKQPGKAIKSVKRNIKGANKKAVKRKSKKVAITQEKKNRLISTSSSGSTSSGISNCDNERLVQAKKSLSTKSLSGPPETANEDGRKSVDSISCKPKAKQESAKTNKNKTKNEKKGNVKKKVASKKVQLPKNTSAGLAGLVPSVSSNVEPKEQLIHNSGITHAVVQVLETSETATTFRPDPVATPPTVETVEIVLDAMDQHGDQQHVVKSEYSTTVEQNIATNLERQCRRFIISLPRLSDQSAFLYSTGKVDSTKLVTQEDSGPKGATCGNTKKRPDEKFQTGGKMKVEGSIKKEEKSFVSGGEVLGVKNERWWLTAGTGVTSKQHTVKQQSAPNADRKPNVAMDSIPSDFAVARCGSISSSKFESTVPSLKLKVIPSGETTVIEVNPPPVPKPDMKRKKPEPPPDVLNSIMQNMTVTHLKIKKVGGKDESRGSRRRNDDQREPGNPVWRRDANSRWSSGRAPWEQSRSSGVGEYISPLARSESSLRRNATARERWSTKNVIRPRVAYESEKPDQEPAGMVYPGSPINEMDGSDGNDEILPLGARSPPDPKRGTPPEVSRSPQQSTEKQPPPWIVDLLQQIRKEKKARKRQSNDEDDAGPSSSRKSPANSMMSGPLFENVSTKPSIFPEKYRNRIPSALRTANGYSRDASVPDPVQAIMGSLFSGRGFEESQATTLLDSREANCLEACAIQGTYSPTSISNSDDLVSLNSNIVHTLTALCAEHGEENLARILIEHLTSQQRNLSTSPLIDATVVTPGFLPQVVGSGTFDDSARLMPDVHPITLAAAGSASDPAANGAAVETENDYTPGQMKEILVMLLNDPTSVLQTDSARRAQASQILPLLEDLELVAKNSNAPVDANVTNPIKQFITKCLEDSCGVSQ